MLTIEWQPLSTSLGYAVPPIIAEAGLGEAYVASLERSRELYGALAEPFPEQCGYAVALAFNIRYSMQLSAREAMHLTELRSGAQGHPSYRVIAQQMHRAIGEIAGHRALAGAMSFVEHGEVELGRLDAEQRLERRRSGGAGGISA